MRTAKNLQQELAGMYGTNGTVIWDHYSMQDKRALETKIRIFFPDKEIPPGETDESIKKNIETENRKMEQYRQTLLNAAWDQRKWCNKNLLTSIIFVLCVPMEGDLNTLESFQNALQKTEFSSHPVLRVRKCVQDNINSSDCCMIFVDENGRVYQNWQDFKVNNAMPEGILICPQKGIYDFNDNGEVILDAFISPVSTVKQKAVRGMDTAAGILGLGATGLTVVAATGLTVVAAPLVIASAATGLGVGLYSIIRSSFSLHDRRIHEQSINITDRQARAAWFGIAGGILGLGAGSATQGLIKYAASGREVSKLIQVGVNGLNAAALAVNVCGVGNGVLEMIFKYQDDEAISALDVMQLSASLFMVTHSIYNYQSASSLINSARDNTIQGFREGLSNRQRKMFNKMSKETIRINGAEQGKMDIIRSLNNIPDRREFFNDIYKANKNLNKYKLKPTFGRDGSVKLNNDISVDSKTLRQNLGSKQPSVGFAKNVAIIPESYTSTSMATAAFNISEMNTTFGEREADIMVAFLKAAFFVLDTSSLKNSLCYIFENLSEFAAKKLIDMAQQIFFIIKKKYRLPIAFENFLWKIFDIIFAMSGNMEVMDVSIREMSIDFLTIQMLNFYETFNLTPSNPKLKKKCPKCPGHYYLVTLDD